MQDVSDQPLPQLPQRQPTSHKSDYGRLMIVGGSRGMAGAPALSALAALRSGAGLVSVATPVSVQATVASYSPCVMTIPLMEDEYGIVALENILELAPARTSYDVWAVGPGLGCSEGATELVGQLYRDVPRPLVLDADGLNALAAMLAQHPQLLAEPAGPRILTPHAGEFARLTGNAAPPAEDDVARTEQAADLARRDPSGQTIVVLKGHRTVITDGQNVAINHTGNPGMATGGTGDCLTGIAAALSAAGLTPWEATRLAVHLHGAAGDLAAQSLGETSLIATDLIDHLPTAFWQLTSA